MSSDQAKKKGHDVGKSRAERVCLDTPWNGIAERMEKWRKRKTWTDTVEDERQYHPGLTDSQWKAFRSAYVTAGLEFVESYIKELKDDGLLKETREKRHTRNIEEKEFNFAGYDFTSSSQGTKVKRGYVDTKRAGDYGADPVGDGTFRMVPSGDIVDFEERNRRLKR